MKKYVLILLAAVVLHGCSGTSQEPADQPDVQQPPAATTPETPEQPSAETPAPNEQQPPAQNSGQAADEADESYGNDAFQKVTVRKTGEDTYEVKGQAKVFEAVFRYVVEDGHNELTEGSVQTSAGAPEWGDFTQTIQVKKAEPNSTLLLILFEESAKDGSRQHELIIPLPEQ